MFFDQHDQTYLLDKKNVGDTNNIFGEINTYIKKTMSERPIFGKKGCLKRNLTQFTPRFLAHYTGFILASEEG